MSYATRRAGVVARNFRTFAVDATVTRPAPDDTPIQTLRANGGGVLWLTPRTEDGPVGSFGRREARRVVALKRSEVSTCPMGTRITATDETGTAGTWEVDAFVLDEAEHYRVSVIEVQE